LIETLKHERVNQEKYIKVEALLLLMYSYQYKTIH